MADTHKNFAKGTLTNSPGTAGTSFILGSGEGALFAANMPVTIVQANTQPDGSNAEIGYVTGVSTDTLTVTRAQQDTTAKNAVAGWQVLGTITAKALTDIEADVAGKADSVHTHTASQVTDFDTEVSNNTDVAANTAARHTHSNSAVLNATTASFTTADETKLDGVAAGATANSSDATLLDRANHTGTQAQSTITNLTTDLAAKVTGVNTSKLTVSTTEPASPASGDLWVDSDDTFGDLAFQNSPLAPDDLASGIVGAAETLEGTTTSTTYTTTLSGSPGTNPSVTFAVPASGIVLLTIGTGMSINSSVNTARISFALTGANTLAADNTRAIRLTPLVADHFTTLQKSFLLTGLTAGSTTATLHYAVTGSTGKYSGRYIIAEPKG